jgi:hypothetical protein
VKSIFCVYFGEIRIDQFMSSVWSWFTSSKPSSSKADSANTAPQTANANDAPKNADKNKVQQTIAFGTELQRPPFVHPYLGYQTSFQFVPRQDLSYRDIHASCVSSNSGQMIHQPIDQYQQPIVIQQFGRAMEGETVCVLLSQPLECHR